MLIDTHVHTAALLPGHGQLSEAARRSVPFRILAHRLAIDVHGDPGRVERAMESALLEVVGNAREVDAAVVLAFDGVYQKSGEPDPEATHLYVSNEYVAGLARAHSRILFGASVHPYRRDAIEELERCAKAGAVLCKWLPITQVIDPADPRCFAFYEALAHFGIPLLSHTGWEHVLPRLDPSVAAPARLVPALERGVTVIAAHSGTGRVPGKGSYLRQFMELAHRHERLYGDTAALSLPNRWSSYEPLLADPLVRGRLVHGSDWPVPAWPRPWQHGLSRSLDLVRVRNGLDRDVLIKRDLGFDDDYWQSAAQILRVPSTHRQ